MLIADGQPPKCKDNKELFFGTVDDGRVEPGRVEREQQAAAICFGCPYRMKCLDHALVTQEPYGVWGGMGEGERRKFMAHLATEGYARHEVPQGMFLAASVAAFYRSRDQQDMPLKVLAEAS